MSKIEKLCEYWGVSEEEMMRELAFSSIVPGICMNDNCDYTTDVEPDQDKGYCEFCQTKTVKSGPMLLGVI